MKAGDQIRTVGIKENSKAYGFGTPTVGKIKHYKIDSLNTKSIVAMTENGYKEYFNFADVIAPSGRVLQIKENGKWRNITKEDMKESEE